MEEKILKAWRHFFPEQDSLGSYINGEFILGSGEEVSLQNALKLTESFSYQEAGGEAAKKAVLTAQQAQKKWVAMTPQKRGQVIQKIKELIDKHQESLARLEALTSHKPLRDCRVEVGVVADMFAYYGGWADKLYGEVIPVPSGHLNYTKKEPLGVILQFTPWNAPIFTAGWQISPALAAGNGVVLKPSELTPWTSIILAYLAEQAGVPRGLINVLVGRGEPILIPALETEAIGKITFVGSVSTGKKIAEIAGRYLVPCLLELGGKSANIVFADANLDDACRGAQAAIFASAGQSCVAGSRLLVERSVYTELVEKLIHGTSQLKVGDPLSPETEIGPIGNLLQYQHIHKSIQEALAEGAHLAYGGVESVELDNTFLQPTVLTEVTNQMKVAQNEIFGPVVVVIPFEDEAEAIKIANETEFGLAGAVWTQNVARAHRVAQKIKAGTVWINGYKTINVASPFGGFKQSGYGRSSGQEVLREYTQTKSIWVEVGKASSNTFGYS